MVAVVAATGHLSERRERKFIAAVVHDGSEGRHEEPPHDGGDMHPRAENHRAADHRSDVLEEVLDGVRVDECAPKGHFVLMVDFVEAFVEPSGVEEAMGHVEESVGCNHTKEELGTEGENRWHPFQTEVVVNWYPTPPVAEGEERSEYKHVCAYEQDCASELLLPRFRVGVPRPRLVEGFVPFEEGDFKFVQSCEEDSTDHKDQPSLRRRPSCEHDFVRVLFRHLVELWEVSLP